MKKFILIILLICPLLISSQELNCQVTVVTDAKLEVTSVEQEIFKQLEQTIFEMMNNTQWTKDVFAVEERINCVLQLQIKSIPSPGSYSGSIQIQSTRPAFNSSYNTTLFNFLDNDLAFAFSRNSILIYAPNQYRDNLTSILAFYAYFIIGMDYDSFSLKGGTKYFNEAQQIVLLAQSSNAPGWKSKESGKRNRFWLVDNILHQLFEPLRECIYQYHRNGIDKLFENKVEGRKAIYKSIDLLTSVVRSRPNSINTQNFVQAKSNELKNLSIDADNQEKIKMVNLLKKIDPSNSSKYQEILN